MPVHEVQQLCDVHSALFHGHTDEECSMLAEADGLPAAHLALVLKRENGALVSLLDNVQAALSDSADADRIKQLLAGLKPIRNHYAKKEQLLMPFLYGYGITGPMDVMWGVDDEIVHETSALVKELSAETYPALRERINSLLKRMREMVYKEEQIFLPLCHDHFTREGKIFARPLSCLGRQVWLCHPPAIIPLVRDMIADFKSGARQNMEVWNPVPGNPVRVLYVPVWSADHEYLGTLEIVQQFGELLPKLKELIG